MRRPCAGVGEPARSDVDGALAAMSAGDLRDLVREMLAELDERAYGRVTSSLVRRAARGGSGWVPAALSSEDVSEVLAFIEAAQRVGHANPSDAAHVPFRHTRYERDQ